MKRFFILLIVAFMATQLFAQMWISTDGRENLSISGRDTLIMSYPRFRAGIRSQITKIPSSQEHWSLNLSSQFIMGARVLDNQRSKIFIDLLVGSGFSFGLESLKGVSSVLGVLQFHKVYLEAEAIQNWQSKKNIFKIGLGLDLEIFMI
ncbi:hypothetical protein K8R66_03065 [bacterium]|nr:hypothetical protein [bacterium]